MTERILKVNRLIRRELGRILQKEAHFGDAIISISTVQTTPNLRLAKVSVSVFPPKNQPEVLEILTKRKGFLQKKLHQKLYMKPLPEIKFLPDDSQEQAERISEILKKDEQQRKAI